jgi:amino-acid N-acetyltransferase
MRIHSPHPQDLPKIKNFLKTIDLPHTDLSPQHMGSFLAAYDGDHLAGLGGLEIFEQTALLRSLAVDQAYRSRGLGSHLLERLEELAREHGVTQIYLLTTDAERFFTHLGYSRTFRESAPAAIQSAPEFASLCSDTAILMTRRI